MVASQGLALPGHEHSLQPRAAREAHRCLVRLSSPATEPRRAPVPQFWATTLLKRSEIADKEGLGPVHGMAEGCWSIAETAFCDTFTATSKCTLTKCIRIMYSKVRHVPLPLQLWRFACV